MLISCSKTPEVKTIVSLGNYTIGETTISLTKEKDKIQYRVNSGGPVNPVIEDNGKWFVHYMNDNEIWVFNGNNELYLRRHVPGEVAVSTNYLMGGILCNSAHLKKLPMVLGNMKTLTQRLPNKGVQENGATSDAFQLRFTFYSDRRWPCRLRRHYQSTCAIKLPKFVSWPP